MKPLFPLLAGLVLVVSAWGADLQPYTVYSDRVVEGEVAASSPDGTSLVSNYSDRSRAWSLTADLAGLPRLVAPGSPLLEALWNLSLEEVLKDKIEGGTLVGALSAGAQWPGVWTRDASYAAHLSLAWIFPDEVKASLRAKVDPRGRIIQDTGTGGSWPVSTDRVVWALAARELARSTGNRAWMTEAYPILVDAAETDRLVAFDPLSGLYRGETSFLDWREQSYPGWFQPADIAASPASGTNALHRALYATLEEWAPVLGRPDAEALVWHDRGQALAEAMNRHLRQSDGTYALFRFPMTAGGGLSDRTDALANALAVLTGVAPEPTLTVRNQPWEAFGPPVIYPQMSQTGPYHNKAVWPFVTAYAGWAAHRAHEPAVALAALEANVRSGALLLTNKENLVHDTGSPQGTAVNSDRQLWSAAGQLSGLLRTLLGLDFDTGLTVTPVVPAWVKGPLTLEGLRWQGRTLSITVVGTGSVVTSYTLDGRPLPPGSRLSPADFPPAGSTVHLEVTLAGDALPPPPPQADAAAKGPWDATSLTLTTAGGVRTLTWKTRAGVARSRILANGVAIGETTGNRFDLPPPPARLTVWSVTTVGETGWAATRAEPVLEAPDRASVSFADRDLGESLGDSRRFELSVPTSGRWLVRFHYTNTSGPVSTDNKAAVRTLVVDGARAGVLVFPQRGYASTNRGWSTAVEVDLTPGSHQLDLTFTPDNTNMDSTVNRAVVDGLEALPME